MHALVWMFALVAVILAPAANAHQHGHKAAPPTVQFIAQFAAKHESTQTFEKMLRMVMHIPPSKSDVRFTQLSGTSIMFVFTGEHAQDRSSMLESLLNVFPAEINSRLGTLSITWRDTGVRGKRNAAAPNTALFTATFAHSHAPMQLVPALRQLLALPQSVGIRFVHVHEKTLSFDFAGPDSHMYATKLVQMISSERTFVEKSLDATSVTFVPLMSNFHRHWHHRHFVSKTLGIVAVGVIGAVAVTALVTYKRHRCETKAALVQPEPDISPSKICV